MKKKLCRVMLGLAVVCVSLVVLESQADAFFGRFGNRGGHRGNHGHHGWNQGGCCASPCAVQEPCCESQPVCDSGCGCDSGCHQGCGHHGRRHRHRGGGGFFGFGGGGGGGGCGCNGGYGGGYGGSYGGGQIIEGSPSDGGQPVPAAPEEPQNGPEPAGPDA
jgi:hypothetical protein